MQKSKTAILALNILIIFITACGGGYNTEYAPPGEKAKLDQVFPSKIEKAEAKIEAMKELKDAIAYKATYNESIIISIIQFRTKLEADSYFKEVIVPVFDKMGSHSRAKVNGKWFAKGTDKNGKNYSWVNNNWIFGIWAKEKKDFNNAINAFEYISN